MSKKDFFVWIFALFSLVFQNVMKEGVTAAFCQAKAVAPPGNKNKICHFWRVNHIFLFTSSTKCFSVKKKKARILL